MTTTPITLYAGTECDIWADHSAMMKATEWSKVPVYCRANGKNYEMGTAARGYSSFSPVGGDGRTLKSTSPVRAEALASKAGAFKTLESLYATFRASGSTPSEDKEPTPAPTPQGGGGLEDKLADALAKLAMDEMLPDLQKKVEDHIINTFGMTPKVYEIRIGEDIKRTEGQLYHSVFGKVVSAIANGIHVFLTGSAGTGKSVIAKQVSEALGIDWYFANRVQEEYRIEGFIDAKGEYQETPFYRAFKFGGLFFLDEMDGSNAEVLTMLNAALANGEYPFPHETVKVHPDFRCIAAGNTWGTGADAVYVGRTQLDGATLNRFIKIAVDYMPELELNAAQGKQDLAEFVRSMRKACEKVGIHHILSMREMIHAAKLDGDPNWTTREVIQSCITGSLAADDIRIIEREMDCPTTNRWRKELVALAV